MFFNSYVFIFAFLPVTLFVFYKIGDMGHHRVAMSWLVGASLFFYGWWNPAYLGLILASILFNYSIGIIFETYKVHRKGVLILGVSVNLMLLAYYKYANFFVDNINVLAGVDFNLEKIILPLAISFFTFQQVAYLVDAYRGETKEYNFLQYCLFVSFFPQLIAGPIVHHKEMLPQFMKDAIYKFNHKNISIGLTIFIIGLFKKVILADNISLYANPVFDAAEQGVVLTFFEAWGGALAYSFQLYFDFSGYSDMAIGLARMFGVRLPVNFHSPYKANSIIEFWRRWHITLSRFLRDYLYFSLGGNRKGNARKFINMFITMLLGGLWHGAGWTFVMWGGMHGVYLIINHAWRMFSKLIGIQDLGNDRIKQGLCRFITFMSVTLAWVFFRSESFDASLNILNSLFGLNGISLPKFLYSEANEYENIYINYGISFNGMFSNGLGQWKTNKIEGVLMLVLLYIIAFYIPNTQQIMRKYKPALNMLVDKAGKIDRVFQWRPTQLRAFIITVAGLLCIVNMNKINEFLYFQF